MSKKSATAHIRIQNIAQGHLISCDHCGAAEIVPLPMSVDDWFRKTERFQKAHRHCPPRAEDGRAAQGA